MNFQTGDILREFAKRVGRSRQRRKGSIVNGEDVVDSQETNCIGSFAGAHREMVANRQTDQIRLINFTDDFHVAKNAGVTRMIQRKTSGQPDDQSGGTDDGF